MDEESIIWKIVHSLWALITLVPFFGGFAFIYIGMRANERKWTYEGIIYLIPLILALSVGNNETVKFFGVYLAILFWFLAIIRAIWLIRPYLQKISYDSSNKEPNTGYGNQGTYYNSIPQTNYSIDFNNGGVSEFQENQTNYNQMNVTSNEVQQDSNVFEINEASVEEISKIPGFNMETAGKVIDLRNSGVYLESLDDMIEKLGLNPEQIELVKSYFEYEDKPDNKTFPNQRKLDL